MTIMTRLDGRQHASQAGRGSLSSLEQLLRALVNDEVRDIPVAGVGITGGSGTIYKASIVERGSIIKTSILLDLTDLSSSTTDLDIIGQSTPAAHLGQIRADMNGTILGGMVTCLEAPVGGVTDIDLYSANEATGVFDGGIAALVETALVTSGAAWTLMRQLAFSGIPPANDYLYLTGGAAGTAAAYTAGKFLIELFGYDA